jgi:hypothetical protein
MARCEGVAKGFAKGLSKGLTCKSKGSKGFVEGYVYKQHYLSSCLKGYRTWLNPFDPFEAQVNPFAHPFAHPFATPSHPSRGA